MNVEEEFIRNLFVRGETQLGRVFVHEPVLSNENALYVLDYERASEVIRTATHRGVGVCYCRHKMMHLGGNIYRCGLHRLTDDGENVLSCVERLVNQCQVFNHSFCHHRPVTPYFDRADEAEKDSSRCSNN